MSPSRPALAGFSMIEILVTIAVLSILAGIGFTSLRPPALQTAASNVRALMQQAKLESIKLNRPVVVSLVGNELRSQSLASGHALQCSTGLTDLRGLDLGDFPRVVAEEAAQMPFVWLPTGQVRDCVGASLSADGAGVVLNDGRRSLTVAVGAGGQVEVR